MAQTGSSRDYFSLAKGLITEAPYARFPLDATVDEQNMDVNRDGSRSRRPGIDYESNYRMQSTFLHIGEIQRSPMSVHRWSNVANDANVSLAVTQFGSILRFFDLSASSVSDTPRNGGNSITIPNIDRVIQPAEINGKLVIPTGQAVYILSYDADNDEVSLESKRLRVRDIWGEVSTEDGDEIEIPYRPTTLDDSHKYNLHNQGFPTETALVMVDNDGRNKYYAEILSHTRAVIGRYPSNSDVYSASLTTISDEAPVEVDAFSAIFMKALVTGNTPAAKGHYIIDPFTRSASRISESGVAGVEEDYDEGGLVSATAFAGRIFYAASVTKRSAARTAPNMNNTILFSKTITNDEDIVKCYQEADPTNKDSNALVDTDGGTVTIPQAAEIYKLVPTARSVLVMASNGVWEITSLEAGFTATSFEVNKISDAGVVGAGSVVEADGVVYYWSAGGVYVLAPNETGTGFKATNITDNTIGTYYHDIAIIEKENASAVYDEGARKIRWMYGGWDGYDAITNAQKYNRELVFDTVLGAWTPMRIYDEDRYEGITAPFVVGAITTPGFSTVSTTDTVTDHNGAVLTANLQNITITTTSRTVGISTIKYLTIENDDSEGSQRFTFSEYNNTTTYKDWKTNAGFWGGKDAVAYLETGYEMLEDQQRAKQATFLTMQLKHNIDRIVDDGGGNYAVRGTGSCTVTPKWEFSTSSGSGKWGTAFEAFRLRPSLVSILANTETAWPENIISTKTRLRGRGKVLRLRMEAKESDDPSIGYGMHVVGWGITFTAGTAV